MATSQEQEETVASPAAAAAAVAAPSANSDDQDQARRIVVLEQLTSVYGFEQDAAEKALDAVGADIQAAVKFITDNGLGKDQGGSVVPKEDCPHIRAHVKISVNDLPRHPQDSVGSFVVAETNGSDSTKQQKQPGQPKSEDPDGTCPTGENWQLEGPKKKKARPNSSDKPPALEQASKEENAETKKDENDEDDDNDNDNNNNNNNNEQEDEDGDSDGSGPTIIDIARAVARGIPYELFQSEDEQELEYPFDSLPTSLEDVANFIQSEKCRNIVILAGAGMSVASGIPDFRSADGLYATMNPDLLSCNPIERESIRSDPTVALEQGMFIQNPLPCLELNREFILGTHTHRWKATLAHRFVELLHAKTGKLVRLYTQNIDGLEDQCTQLPRNKVIAVHGSMDRSECAQCGAESDYNQFCSLVRTQIKDLSGKDATAPQESTPIRCTSCGANTVKPAIVLFRSSLPAQFFESVPRDILDVDLLIVIGTSLRVAPANSLVWRVPKTALRLLVNREPVGWHLGMTSGEDSTRDVFAQGNCDSVLLQLMSHLGWLNDLEPLLRENKLPASSASLLAMRLGRGSSLENRDRSNGECSSS